MPEKTAGAPRKKNARPACEFTAVAACSCEPISCVVISALASASTEVIEPALEIRAELSRPLDRLETIRRKLEKVLMQPDSVGLCLVDEERANEATHMDIMHSFLDMHASKPPLPGQQARRDLECLVRLRGVHCAREMCKLGCTQEEAARRLGISARALRMWDGNARRGHLDLQPLGRPLARSEPQRQQEVFAWLHEIGPGIGVPALRKHFDDMARAELDEILKFYRQLWRAQNLRDLRRLHWQKPGTVWAMDFSEPPCAIDGKHPYLLAVRDLASGMQLLWEPVAAPTAEVTIELLRMLFTMHGAPLVLKSDNGSAFIAGALQQILHDWRVFPLFSPPRTPAYNGSIEASIGAAKARTQAEADRLGHPNFWTSENVAAGRQRGNTTVPAKSKDGQTPEQKWSTRLLISDAQRTTFAATVESQRAIARQELDLPPTDDLSRTEQAQVDRKALSRALVAHDLLLFTRRQIPPQIPRPKAASKG